MKARVVGVLAIGASVLLGATGRVEARAGAGGGEMKELSGKVIKAETSTLYLEHMGAVVPIEISRDTRFSGVRSADDLAGGEEVRASFTVDEETRNIADSISLGALPIAAPVRRVVGDDPYNQGQDFGG